MNITAAMERVQQATGAKSQMALAHILGIRQSSISDAKRRGSLPDAWLLKLFRQFDLNPDWITEGQQPQYLRQREIPTIPANPAQGTSLESVMQGILDSVAAARTQHPHLGRSLEQARRAVVSEHKEWEAQALLIENPDGSINEKRLQKTGKEGMDCITTHVRFLIGDFIGLA